MLGKQFAPVRCPVRYFVFKLHDYHQSNTTNKRIFYIMISNIKLSEETDLFFAPNRA